MRALVNEQEPAPSGVLTGFVAMSGFDIRIDGDGGNAFVTLLSRKVGIFRLKIAFALMSRLHHAVDITVDQMLHRQGAFLDEGESTVEHIKARAPSINAKGCEISLDERGDVVMLFQFDEGPPMAVRMTPEEAIALDGQWQKLRATIFN